MRTLLLTLTGILLANALTAAVITGQVFYLDASDELRRLTFLTPAYTSVQHVSHYAPLDEAGQFRLDLSIPEPTEVVLAIGEHHHTLLLAPGDSLHVSFDWNEWVATGNSALRFTGEGAERQRQLRELEEAFAKKFAPWNLKRLLSQSPAEALRLTRRRQEQEIAFWRSWDIPDAILRSYTEQNAFFGALLHLLPYAVQRREEGQPLAPIPGFFNFFPAILRQQQIGVNTFALQRICRAYIEYLNLIISANAKDLTKASEEQPSRMVRKQGEIIRQISLPAEMRDRLLTKIHDQNK